MPSALLESALQVACAVCGAFFVASFFLTLSAALTALREIGCAPIDSMHLRRTISWKLPMIMEACRVAENEREDEDSTVDSELHAPEERTAKEVECIGTTKQHSDKHTHRNIVASAPHPNSHRYSTFFATSTLIPSNGLGLCADPGNCTE